MAIPDRPHVVKARPTHWPPRGPARVLLVLDRMPLVELIKMALNHGVYAVRAATLAADVASVLAEWQPHLALIDMDLEGARIMALLQETPLGGIRLPVIGLTR
jgi:DNA-binding NtrC family response regulator